MLEWLSAKLDLEFVAEYDDGYVIFATEDIDLKGFKKLANDFIRAERGSGKMASVLEVNIRIHRIYGALNEFSTRLCNVFGHLMTTVHIFWMYQLRRHLTKSRKRNQLKILTGSLKQMKKAGLNLAENYRVLGGIR